MASKAASGTPGPGGDPSPGQTPADPPNDSRGRFRISAPPEPRQSEVARADADDAAPEGAAANTEHGPLFGLALGSLGVVFGDIGTSPIYALREALSHSRNTGELAILGVVSLVLWTLTLIVTVKYVILLMRADNKGEGGTLALMALAQRALGKRSIFVFLLGVLGAALFYGDGIITPAISVLGAIEGVKDAPAIGHILGPYVLPISAGVLIALFLVQSRGTHQIGKLFGPICALWFLTIAGLGLIHISDDWSIFRAFNPLYGVRFLIDNGLLGFIILGSVFLAVTGAEALYADMGHFGRTPIRVAWVFVFVCLALNYLGQGALVLHNPAARADPFWHLAPKAVYWPVLALATCAAIIASQAVITGAFSITQQAVQLGLLPRIDIRRTSETQAGQIFVPQVNGFLMVGVLILLVVFQSSHRLAAAYGIAVTGAMFVDTLLAFVIMKRVWKWSTLRSLALLVPLGCLDIAFISSNMLKIPDGAWLPLALGAALVLLMVTWVRGSQILTDKTRRDAIPLAGLLEMLANRKPHQVPGTAIFLTSDTDMAPVALMHNLKHNKVLHEKNIILTVRSAETPRVKEEDRVKITPISDNFKKAVITYGFMEQPNIPKALQLCRKSGEIKFDIMSTSFFLGRRTVVPSAQSGMPLWQDRIYIFLLKNAANPTDFFRIPVGRVVELGAQVTV